MVFQKSPRHSKITGDFAEGLVLYWLSKYGYDCMRVDHVGIDLIACKPDGSERIGISVKCRSRYDGTEKESVRLPADGFDKAAQTCRHFDLTPYYAVVIDGGGYVRCFLTSLEHLQQIAGGTPGSTRYWQMTDPVKYTSDPLIQRFEMQIAADSLRDVASNASAMQPSPTGTQS